MQFVTLEIFHSQQYESSTNIQRKPAPLQTKGCHSATFVITDGIQVVIIDNPRYNMWWQKLASWELSIFSVHQMSVSNKNCKAVRMNHPSYTTPDAINFIIHYGSLLLLKRDGQHWAWCYNKDSLRNTVWCRYKAVNFPKILTIDTP